ncbi:MAG: hypothetical protein DME20_08145 [Verrucomicrobia bacterium]|nr:MAG: hypothetical protein DME20_08145 [Verrucomicrobiota bacterium]
MQLLGRDRLLRVNFQRLRVAEIIFHLLFNLRGRHHLIERRLRLQIFFRPNPVPPVNVFNHALISDPVREAEGSLGLLRWHHGCRSAIEAALRQCEWNRANAQEQKQVKRASNNLGFNGGIGFFHFVRLSAGIAVETHEHSIPKRNVIREELRSRQQQASQVLFLIQSRSGSEKFPVKHHP